MLELILVMAILAAILLYGWSNSLSYSKRAEDIELQQVIQECSLAMERYYAQHGQYSCGDNNSGACLGRRGAYPNLCPVTYTYQGKHLYDLVWSTPVNPQRFSLRLVLQDRR